MKKDSPGMAFEAYPHRIMSLNDFTKQKVKKFQENRFEIKKHQNENTEDIQKTICWIKL